MPEPPQLSRKDGPLAISDKYPAEGGSRAALNKHRLVSCVSPALIYDLDDYKLETSFEGDCILHKSYRSDPARGIRKVAVVERWAPQKPVIGIGSFGTVRLERLTSDSDEGRRKTRAVKQLSKLRLESTKIDYKNELIALTKFSRSKFAQSQIFVEFIGWFDDDESVFLAMEYFPLGTLAKYIDERLQEQDAQAIAFQLLEGLKIMHEEGFTHRDLKPQNIFVVHTSPSWWIKIGDFGITKRVSNNDTALRTATGTAQYLAPEVHQYIDTTDDSYTNAIDIWSFACITYQMLALQTPFPVFPRNLKTFCRGGPFPEAPLFGTSKDGIDFVRSVLIPLPDLRPTAEEALRLKWLENEENDNRDQSFQIEPRTSSTTTPNDNNDKKITQELPSSQQEEIQPPSTFSTFQPYTWKSENTSSPSARSTELYSALPEDSLNPSFSNAVLDSTGVQKSELDLTVALQKDFMNSNVKSTEEPLYENSPKISPQAVNRRSQLPSDGGLYSKLSYGPGTGPGERAGEGEASTAAADLDPVAEIDLPPLRRSSSSHISDISDTGAVIFDYEPKRKKERKINSRLAGLLMLSANRPRSQSRQLRIGRWSA